MKHPLSLLILLCLFACGDKANRVSDEQMQDMRALVASTDARFHEDLQHWRSQVRELSTRALSTTPEPCGQGEAAMNRADWDTTVRLPELDELVPDHLGDSQRALAKAREVLEYAEDKGENMHASAYEMLERNLREPQVSTGGDLVLVIESELKPEMIDNTTYKGGFVKGRLLWWDHESGGFACVGLTEATSDEAMTAYGNKHQTLESNLEYRARERGVGTLVRLEAQ